MTTIPESSPVSIIPSAPRSHRFPTYCWSSSSGRGPKKASPSCSTSKEKFVNGVIELGLQMVGKLRVDANLCHIFTGEQKPRGRRRKYGEKVDLRDLTGLSWVQDLEANLKLYTAVVWHMSLKRQVRIAYLFDTRQPDKIGHVLLFSTDLNLTAYDIFCFYKARFQIEFIFRDVKQFTGLGDCQARSEYKLDFHFNASLTALNLAKFEAQQRHQSRATAHIS